jgi:hypothetical protein
MAGNLVGFVAQPMTASLHLLCWPALRHKNKKLGKNNRKTCVPDLVLIRIQFLFKKGYSCQKFKKGRQMKQC